MRQDAGINGDAQRIEQITWPLFLKVYDAKEQDWTFDDEDYQSIIPDECRWADWARDDKSGQAMITSFDPHQFIRFFLHFLCPLFREGLTTRCSLF